MGDILKKYRSQLTAVLIVLVLSLSLSLARLFSEAKVKKLPISEMIPEGFVLLPIEIHNGEDLIHLLGSHGVVDLYTLSLATGHPEELAAQALKVLLPFPGDSRFVSIVPEKQLVYFLEHRGPFYAVLQNPKKSPSRIHRKKIKSKLKIIGEGD